MAPLLLISAALLGMGSPWWEDYTTKELYLCPNLGTLVLERNDAQASLLSGRSRSTLFREPNGDGSIRYRNDLITLILRGDVLTLEQLPRRIDCLRTEQA